MRCEFCAVEPLRDGLWHRFWCPLRNSIVWGTVLVLLAFAGSARGQEYASYPKGAVLHVSSFPSGATVTVDGVTMADRDDNTLATTPIHFDLSLGKHTITIGLADPGWAPYTNTINITKKDNDLSATLLPVLTQGLQGSAGPIGPAGVSVTSAAELPGIHCAFGGAAFLAANTTTYACNGMPGGVGPASTVPGPAGKDGLSAMVTIGSVVTLPPGSQVSVTNSGTPSAAILNFAIPTGTSSPGVQGPAGPSSFQGIWSPTGAYNIGDSVMRDPSLGGSRGPFFSLTGINSGDPGVGAEDPAVDGKDWVYCCGTAVVGYINPSTSGSFGLSMSPNQSSSYNSQQPFNASNAYTFNTLTVTISSITSTTTVTQTVSGKCYVGNAFIAGLGGYSSACPGGSPPQGWTLDPNTGGAYNGYFGSTTTTTTTNNTPGSITFTVQRNGADTGLTVASGNPGTYTVTSAVQFNSGDSIALILRNPSGVTDTVSGSWQVQ